MMITASFAAGTSTPGDGVGVGGIAVAVDVGREVGQGVMVGRSVGVPVGWVGVGVKPTRTIIFCSGYITDFSVRPFNLRSSGSESP